MFKLKNVGYGIVSITTQKLADKPNSETWQAALTEELEFILQNDAALADAIAIILEKKATKSSTTNNIPQAVNENKAQVIGQMYNSKAKNIGLLTRKDWQVLLLAD